MDMKRHLKSALKQLGFDKPRKAQIIPMNTLDAEQDAIVIAATGSGKQVIYETVGLAHSDKLTIVIEPLLALIYNQVQTLQAHDIPADYIDMTRSKEDIDKIRGLGLGADDYITKPFSPSEMVARVKAHLARYERLIGSSMPDNEIIEIRGLKIDKTARRVWVNGEEKNFTTKEFDLLTFLAQNPNHVYTKEELFNKIWDMESIGDIATVTVHIKKIREKIEFNTAKPQYIETIWGVGYRFKV